MTPEQRKYHREYAARWRAANPERARAAWKRDRERNREKRLAALKAYREQHQAERAAYMAAYRAEHEAELRRYAVTYQDANREKVREAQRTYRATPNGRESKARTEARDRTTGATAARHAVAWAIQTGALVRGMCQNCGAAGVEAHHHLGYAPENRLNVLWLCRAHHEEAHHGDRAAVRL